MKKKENKVLLIKIAHVCYLLLIMILRCLFQKMSDGLLYLNVVQDIKVTPNYGIYTRYPVKLGWRDQAANPDDNMSPVCSLAPFSSLLTLSPSLSSFSLSPSLFRILSLSLFPLTPRPSRPFSLPHPVLPACIHGAHTCERILARVIACPCLQSHKLLASVYL